MSDKNPNESGGADKQQDRQQSAFSRFVNKIAVSRETANTIATILLVVVGAWGIYETKAAIRTAERAWVYTVSASYQVQPAEGQPLHFFITVSNSGREPATDVHYGPLQQGVIDSPRNYDFSNVQLEPNVSCDFLEPAPDGGIVPPAGPAGIIINRTMDSGRGSQPIFADADVVSGKKFFYVQGCIVYRTFGEVHRTAYCYIFMRLPGVQQPVPVQPPAPAIVPGALNGTVITSPKTVTPVSGPIATLVDVPSACGSGNFTN